MDDNAFAEEDRWEVPGAWRGRALPTPGSSPRRAVRVERSAAAERAEFLAAHQDSIETMLTGMAAADDTELAGAARGTLTGATPTPLGAAVLALGLDLVGGNWPPNESQIVDAWVLEHGVTFAVEAVFESLCLTFDWANHRYTVRRAHNSTFGGAAGQLRRLRAHLAGLPGDEYRTLVAYLGELRTADPRPRCAASFLAPTENDWLTADLDELAVTSPGDHRWDLAILLIASVHTRAQLDILVSKFPAYSFAAKENRDLVYTALTALGPDCAGMLNHMLSGWNADSARTRTLATMLAQLPGDEAFGVLLAHVENRHIAAALAEAAHRFPRRATRLLSRAADLPPAVRALVDAATGHNVADSPVAQSDTADTTGTPVPTATIEQLPEVLRSAPWRRTVTPSDPVVITDLVAPTSTRLDWAPGEREAWEQLPISEWHYGTDDEFRAYVERMIGEQNDFQLLYIFAVGPLVPARPYLTRARLRRPGNAGVPLRHTLARFGEDAVDYVMSGVRVSPAALADILGPITGTTTALTMMRWLDGSRTRDAALSWFDRHLDGALPDLIAAALSAPGKDRTCAEQALHLLSEHGHSHRIAATAAALGEPAASAIESLLRSDPLLRLPSRIPELPIWLATRSLRPVLLREGGAALPDRAVRDLCTMLAMCGPQGDYAGVAQVAAAAEPDSLAEFGWAIFEAWQRARYPSRDSWALHALGLLGDDETARRLTPLIRAWPGETAHARAVAALDVLAAIGSDVALMQVKGIAEKVKFQGIRKRANEKIQQIAAAAGMSAEELADRLVPDFGLSAAGTLRLDYGPRGFVIGFDEQLRPTVADADGTPRKSLPKPGAKDDPVRAPEAYQAFATLRKDVKQIAAQEIQRLERAMVTGRRWQAGLHRRLFAEHPLLMHLSRRVVWARFDDEGKAVGSFRIAEDRTLADAADESVTLGDDAIVGIAHPLHLDGALPAWGEVFADYEILQPFAQLRRETYELRPDEHGALELDRFTGMSVPVTALLGMTRFGWRRQPPQDNGVAEVIVRRVNEDHSLVICLDPGISIGMGGEQEDQELASIMLTPVGDEGVYRYGRRTQLAFGRLNPVSASEILREFHALTS